MATTKNALLGLYKYSGAMHAQEALHHWTGMPFISMLLFHRVTDAVPPDGLTVGVDFFRRLCRMVRDRFHVVPLAEVFRLLQTGERPRRRTVAITFDDCYQDNHAAAQVLAEHGLPACFFIPTDYVGASKPFPWDAHLPPLANLTWDEVRDMAAMGHEIGSHTVSHCNLGQLSPANALWELSQSKQILEDRLQRPVHWFALPFGGREHFRTEQLALIQRAGYKGWVSAQTGFVNLDMHGQMLPRIPVPAFANLLHLELHMTGCLSWMHTLKAKVGLFF